jgi:MFS family permease
MIDIRKDYSGIQKSIFYLIAAEFFIQLVANALLYILPLYMHAESYTDGEIGRYVSFRFLGVMLTAVPLGFLIKGRRLKNYFIATGIFMPLLTIISLWAIAHHKAAVIDLTQFLIGIFFSFFSVAILPYIIRNEKTESHTGALSLHFVVISLGTVMGGWIIGFLNLLNPVLFNEENSLIIIAVLGFLNLFFLARVKTVENVPLAESKKINFRKDFDWKLIWYTLLPTILVSLGAGLTVPFLGLFFANIHNMGMGVFALMSSSSSVLIVIATLYIPYLKRRMGMRSSITWIQILAVMALVLMASTQYYSAMHVAIVIAVVAYFMRNPLMNMVSPLTSELSMAYAGGRNSEMVSALIFAIAWAGYFVSALAFEWLRNHNVDYASIFYMTAALYLSGVYFFYQIAGKQKATGI